MNKDIRYIQFKTSFSQSILPEAVIIISLAKEKQRKRTFVQK